MKRKPGRPTLYTPERVKIIIATIKLGGSEVDACARAGIDQDTIYQWKLKYPDFSEVLARARVDGKIARVNRIRHAGIKGDWRADAWYLERRYPEEYAQQLIVKVTPEQAALLKRNGFSPSEAFEAMINEFANAEQSTD